MNRDVGSVWDALQTRSVSRRDFLKFCTSVGAALALPADKTPQIVQALEQKQRPPPLAHCQ